SQCSDSVCTNYYILKQEKLDQIHEVIFVNATAVPTVTGSDNIQWNIFPNPASTNIRIETNAGKIDAVRITDVSGRVMKEIFSYTNDFISLQSLPKGAYIVQTLIGGTWRSKLLIRQ